MYFIFILSFNLCILPQKEELEATTQINYNSTFGTSDSASGTSDGSLGSSVVVVVVVPSVVVVVVVGLAVTVKVQTAVLLPFSID